MFERVLNMPLTALSLFFLELLWVAPELIKDYNCTGKSKEGDVYSYGIILSEILSREDPYAEYEMEPQGNFRI